MKRSVGTSRLYLPPVLRQAGATTVEVVNRHLRERFVRASNVRFGQPAAEEGTASSPLPARRGATRCTQGVLSC